MWVSSPSLSYSRCCSFSAGCSGRSGIQQPILNWYVFDEPSGAFIDAANTCSRQSGGTYTINLVPLPADADQQREQLVRRLAAHDSAIDIIGMDVIWTAEFCRCRLDSTLA